MKIHASCSQNTNINKKKQKSVNYKSSFEHGLCLLKDSLNEINSSPYRVILTYFTYPLSKIEDAVANAKKNKIDTNEFYKEKCNELFEIYERLLATKLLCQSEFGNKEEKKKANEVLNAIKNQLNCSAEVLNEKEPVAKQKIHKDKTRHRKLSLFKKITQQNYKK